jgi:hypothetical protein
LLHRVALWSYRDLFEHRKKHVLQHFGYWYVPLFMINCSYILFNNQETEVQNYKEREVHDLSLLTSDFYIML